MLRFLTLLLLIPLAACATIPDRSPAFASDRLSVEVRGSGPEVVLIPGLSSPPSVWNQAVAAVPGYRYHLVHVAGFAGKPAGANASGPVVEPVAEEIARYIRGAGLGRVAIVGHSLGGTWAMMIAARHPELVSRVMVVDMPPAIGPFFAGPNASPDAVRAVADRMRQTLAGDTRRAFVERFVSPMMNDEGKRAAIIEAFLASDPVVSGQALYEVITTDLGPELANIHVPLTVLYVRAPEAPVSEAQMDQFYRLAYAPVAGAVVRRVPDARHFIMFDQPEGFARELRVFLEAR